MRTLLIDSDILAYEFAAKSQRSYDFGGGVVTSAVDPLEEVCERVALRLRKLKKDLKADDMIICLSDPVKNWRKDVLPSYKANRAGAIKPDHLFPIKDWLAQNYRSFIRPTLEADDVMGILATHPTLVKGEKVIVSEDKDMGQIPGRWFNPNKGMRVVTPLEGERLHYLQMLTGDPVDGYKGCPGVGPVKANALLDGAPYDIRRDSRDYWHVVVQAYEEAYQRIQDDEPAPGYAEAAALAQARVSKILQWTDYNYKRKEPKLWNPPSSAS